MRDVFVDTPRFVAVEDPAELIVAQLQRMEMLHQ